MMEAEKKPEKNERKGTVNDPLPLLPIKIQFQQLELSPTDINLVTDLRMYLISNLYMEIGQTRFMMKTCNNIQKKNQTLNLVNLAIPQWNFHVSTILEDNNFLRII